MSLNLSFGQTINNLTDSINNLTSDLSGMNFNILSSELLNDLTVLNNKLNTIVKMYNDVAELQSKVDIVKSSN
jgi:hypothetical protein